MWNNRKLHEIIREWKVIMQLRLLDSDEQQATCNANETEWACYNNLNQMEKNNMPDQY